MRPATPVVWRSMLFVPGDRPDRFAKALAAGADAVCLDLEDGVRPANKAAAREHIRTFLLTEGPDGVARAVRTNLVASRDGLMDLVALGQAGPRLDAVLLPKVETAATCAVAAGALAGSGVELVALLESVAGLTQAQAIAAAPGVARIVFGSADYAAEVGCAMTAEALAYPRAQVAQAAAVAGVQAIDGAWLALADEEGLLADCASARALGFSGKPALHPRQVEAITRAFSPSAEAVERARAVIAAVAAEGGGVAVLDGRMLDAPLVLQARRILALAERPMPTPAPNLPTPRKEAIA